MSGGGSTQSKYIQLRNPLLQGIICWGTSKVKAQVLQTNNLCIVQALQQTVNAQEQLTKMTNITIDFYLYLFILTF